MLRLTRSRAMKTLTRGVFVAALIALIGFAATELAAQGQRLWSIVIHFQYQDGFEFDYVLQRGVSTPELGAALAECGRSHRTGSVVRYYCYPVAE
jgi:RsiW-degrading membrane proteinase PrsW (M82 family)